MARLKRKSLSEQLAQGITKDITEGVWSERLPGFRVLAKRYDVSRPTCESAAAILERNGLIGPAVPGKMRRILRAKTMQRASTKLRLLVVIDSFHQPAPLDEELITQFENFWKLEYGEVSRVECDMMRARSPHIQLAKWLKASGADCILFETIAPKWVGPVEKLGLPCYATGGSVGQGSGVLSGTGFKLDLHIRKVLHQLLDLKHRRILFVMGRATNEAMKNQVQSQVTQMLAKDWADQEVSFSIMSPDLLTPADWQDWWHSTLLTQQPTVVLIDCVYLGLSLHNFCLERGVKMPSDLSLVVLDDAKFITWLNPPLARYCFKHKDAFRHFRSWVRGNFVPGSIKFCGAEFIGGQTLGPAKKSTSKKP